MKHHFKVLNEILCELAKNSDKETINKANNALKSIYNAINSYNHVNERFLNDNEKLLKCLYAFGYIPYNWRLLNNDFIDFVFNYDCEFDELELMSACCMFENFKDSILREPNSKEEFEKFLLLDEKTIAEIYLKYNIKHDVNHKVI